MCRRGSSMAGDMFHLPGGINMCSDCMRRSLDQMNSLGMGDMFGGGMPAMQFTVTREDTAAKPKVQGGMPDGSDLDERTGEAAPEKDTDKPDTDEPARESPDQEDAKKDGNRNGPFGIPSIQFLNWSDMGFGPRQKQVKSDPEALKKQFDLGNIPKPHKLKEMLDKDGIKNDFIELEGGFTRINVKIKYGKELDINANGPEINEDRLTELFSKLSRLHEGDWLVLAGSVPPSLPDDLYSKISEGLYGKGIRVVVDTTGNQLLNVLKYKPFLIKPNHHELAEIFGEEMDTAEKITRYAKKLREMGAVNVLVSRGKDGAVLVDGDGGVHIADAVEGKLVNSVGCGDSMVAGFIAGCIKSGNYKDALKLSVASSAATAFSKGLAKAEEINKIYKTL